MCDRISCREGVDGYGKLGINLGNRSKVAEPATVVGCREYGQHLPSYPMITQVLDQEQA